MDKRDLFTVSDIAQPQRLRRLGDSLLREPGTDHRDPDEPAVSADSSDRCCGGWPSSRQPETSDLSLDEVADALAELPDGRTPTRADWARLSRTWRARLDDQIAGLIALRDNLDSCIGCGCLSLKRCAISNPGDSAAVAGAGAVYLPKSLRRQAIRG